MSLDYCISEKCIHEIHSGHLGKRKVRLHLSAMESDGALCVVSDIQAHITRFPSLRAGTYKEIEIKETDSFFDGRTILTETQHKRVVRNFSVHGKRIVMRWHGSDLDLGVKFIF